PAPHAQSGLSAGHSSCAFLEQLAADQHTADLAGAGTDLVQLGIAPQPAGRVVVDVTVATEDLDRLAGHPGRLFGRIQDGAGGVLARGLTAVAGLGHRVDIGPAGVEADIHVRELALDQLELAD